MTTAELLETVRRVEVRANRAPVAVGIRACRRAGHLARRKESHYHLSRRNNREPANSRCFVPGCRMPPSTSGKDARRYAKPLEFERFGNCGEFATFRNQAVAVFSGLIPSNSTGLEFSRLELCFNSLEFEGVRN